MPDENVQETALYYGFIVYLLLVFLYCRWIEKRSLVTIGFNKCIPDYIIGACIAVILLVIIMGIGCLAGGFIIQGAAEEAMCRGFLMASLQKKVSTPVAIFWSATVFAFPHFSNLFMSDFQYALIGVINLYMIFAIFSLLVLYRKNIWVACGLHSIWNFLLYGVFGLTLSGKESGEAGILLFQEKETNILNGGPYGLESGVITTVVCGITLILLSRVWSGQRRNENGI